jgi:2,4-didehydro-3-deoxy-L-rhamnonate hydrolase
MRIVRYRTGEVATQIGVLTGDGVVATPYRDMVEFLAAGDTALAAAHRAADGAVLEPDFTLLAPLPNPGKMLFLGRSFRQFRTGLGDGDPVFVYSRVPSSVVGPGDAIRMPGPDEHVLYEAELLIVIGRGGRRVAREAAMDHVFGYTQVNDITWTDWIHGGDLPQITLSKNADTFCPMGPYIVTADDYDPYGAEFTVTVNGEVRTRGTMADLVWDIPRIIEFLSRDMTLHPGDVIATGTSDAQPIVAGDTVTVAFDGLGALVNPVLPGW